MEKLTAEIQTEIYQKFRSLGKWFCSRRCMDEYAKKQSIRFATFISKGMWTKYENAQQFTEVPKWYNTYRYSVMEKPLTSEELYNEFLKQEGK